MKKICNMRQYIGLFCLASFCTVSIVCAVCVTPSSIEETYIAVEQDLEKSMIEQWIRYFSDPREKGNGLVTLDTCVSATIHCYKDVAQYKDVCGKLGSLRHNFDPEFIWEVLNELGYEYNLNSQDSQACVVVPEVLRVVLHQGIKASGMTRIAERCAFALLIDFIDARQSYDLLHWSKFVPKITSLLEGIKKYKDVCACLNSVSSSRSVLVIGPRLRDLFTKYEKLLPPDLVDHASSKGISAMLGVLRGRIKL